MELKDRVMNLRGSMLYTRSTFTLPANEKKMSDVEWEIKMGIICEQCLQKIETSFAEHVCQMKDVTI